MFIIIIIIIGNGAFSNCPFTCIYWDPSISRSIGSNALQTRTVCPPSTAPTLVPTVSPTKVPTVLPTYGAGKPTPSPSAVPTLTPTLVPTYSPTTDHPVVECKSNGGSGCCSLCNSKPCTMTFSSDVTYIGMKYECTINTYTISNITSYID